MRAVLFDLDGTLLDIEIDAFIRRYFAALGPVVAGLAGDSVDAQDAVGIVMQATRAMMRPHPGVTNQAAFDRAFVDLTGVDLDIAYERFNDFYDSVFPTLREGLGPRAGAVEAVESALSLGLKVAVATNPIFPETAIRQRMSWAGLDGLDIPVVTTFEIMHACKPDPAYFAETAALLHVEPTGCLMVGDDETLDLPAGAVGMKTYFVGPARPHSATFCGNLEQLPSLLDRLAGR